MIRITNAPPASIDSRRSDTLPVEIKCFKPCVKAGLMRDGSES